MRRFISWAAAAVICGAAVAAALPAVERADARYREENRRVILIDPGHGGADGGAEGVDGTLEKEVNLAVGRTLAAFLRVMGYDVAMTRERDISIHSPEAATLRQQKVSDMRNRLALYEGAAAVVSIHQNQFSEAKYSGAQMFYGPLNPASRDLAEEIRGRVTCLLQPENRRELKQADDNIYLLAHTRVPAVIVECGFLSNPGECALLASPHYQRQMAFAVGAGVMGFFGPNGL